MNVIPVDASALGSTTKVDAYVKTDVDGNAKINKAGQAEYTLEVLVKREAGRKGELITVTSTDEQVLNIPVGSALKFTGLTAGTMATQSGFIHFFRTESVEVATGTHAVSPAGKSDKQ